MKICRGSMGERYICGMTTIDYKHGCLTSLEFTPHDLSWHIAMDSIMLDTKEGLVHLLTTMINMNK